MAELVRARHSKAEALKASLRAAQDEPGVITRSGILINANTRCVLMRELLADGEITRDAIRVAVLPENIGPDAVYDLEAVLQKQDDHKDEYDLVSELMMYRTLFTQAKMTEKQIASRQRGTTARDVALGFKILDLMERARHLVSPPLPITTFGGAKTQRQNWKELLRRVDEAEKLGGKPAGDHVLREYLPLHLLGLDSVHNMRAADSNWISEYLLDALKKHDGIGKKIASIASQAETPTDAGDLGELDVDGLDLLDFGREDEPVDGASTRTLLDLTLAATQAGTLGEVYLDGTKHAAGDLIDALKSSTGVALKTAQNRIDAGDALEAPGKLLEKAHLNLVQANKALGRVFEDDAYVPYAEAALAFLDDLAAQIDEAREMLEQVPQP